MLLRSNQLVNSHANPLSRQRDFRGARLPAVDVDVAIVVGAEGLARLGVVVDVVGHDVEVVADAVAVVEVGRPVEHGVGHDGRLVRQVARAGHVVSVLAAVGVDLLEVERALDWRDVEAVHDVLRAVGGLFGGLVRCAPHDAVHYERVAVHLPRHVAH
ncbi:NADP-dependent malic enzyme [Babesia caballi]|uniref:NADP-dependent malic enzyme n=1 Tax=Babesia caballi TaxID=5871 RepID=A0AAV4M360_BABCB|nr:NADP-dependent malic enzyme [Babesia caballi]